MSDTEEGPWKITAKDILDGMINYSSARHTSQIEYDDLTNKSKPLVGDLLLTKDGTLGRTAIVDAENVCINQSVALLRFNEKCSVQYAKTLLDTPMYQKQMLDDAGGGTIKHIYITKVDKMFISVPCMKEQERLVLFFNNLDNLITLHQRKPIPHPNYPTTHTKHKGEEKYVRIRVNDREKTDRTANLRRFPVDISGGFKDRGRSVGEFQIYSGAE